MNIQLGEYTLTTEHPASRYGAGVLLGPEGDGFGPSDVLPEGEISPQKLFGVNIKIEAGDYVRSRITSRTESLSIEEVEIARRYLSQHPRPKYFDLPDYETLCFYWERNADAADRENRI